MWVSREGLGWARLLLAVPALYLDSAREPSRDPVIFFRAKPPPAASLNGNSLVEPPSRPPCYLLPAPVPAHLSFRGSSSWPRVTPRATKPDCGPNVTGTVGTKALKRRIDPRSLALFRVAVDTQALPSSCGRTALIVMLFAIRCEWALPSYTASALMLLLCRFATTNPNPNMSAVHSSEPRSVA